MFGLQWHGMAWDNHATFIPSNFGRPSCATLLGHWPVDHPVDHGSHLVTCFSIAATWWILGVWSAQGWHVFGKKTAVVFTMFRCKTQGKKWKTPRIPCIIWNNTEARDIDHQQNMGEWEPQKYHSLSMWDYDTRLFYIFTPAISDKKWGIIKQLELMNTKTSDMPVFIRQPPFDILPLLINLARAHSLTVEPFTLGITSQFCHKVFLGERLWSLNSKWTCISLHMDILKGQTSV